jgi:hypothetical protein
MNDEACSILGRHADIMTAVYDRLDNVHKRPLHKGQIQVAKDYFIKGKRVVMSQWSRNGGKALALDTPILTTTGWRTMGTVQVGDYVYAVDGTPSRIITTSPIMVDHKCYQVTFNDGTKIVADAEHRWVTSTRSIRSSIKKNKGKMPNRSPLRFPKISTTEEISKSLYWGPEYNHTISTCAPLSISPQQLEIDPYVLGAWLGDGKQDAGYLYSNDPFIVEEFVRLGHPVVKTKRAFEYSFSNLHTHIRKLKLERNKHIPEKYLLSGASQRLALLQGLMDTDGYVSKTGRTNFCNINKNIAYGVKFLAESLGMRVSVNTKIPKCNGKDCSLAYIVEIIPNQQIFRLPRKAARLSPALGKRKGANRRTVVAVDEVPSVPVRCIGIDHPSHLFLAGKSLVPTHNTECALFLANVACLLNDNFQVMIICPELKQGKKIYWHKKRLQNYAPPQFIKDINTTDLKVEFLNGSIITVDGCENYEGLRGVKPDLVIYDEFQHHSKEFHLEVMEPNLLSKDKALFIFGTPPKKRSAYYVEFREQLLERIKLGDSLSSYYEFNASINPVNDAQLLLEKRKQLIESDNEVIWYREYEGKLAFGGEDVVFPKWNPKTHCRPHAVVTSFIEGDRHKLRWFTICDPGTSTCFAVLFAAYNPYTQQIFVLDEIYERDRNRTDTRQIWERIRKKEEELYPNAPQRTWKRIYDEAAAWFQREVQANYHESLMPSAKNFSNEEDDISRIKMLMTNPGSLTVSDRCYWFRWEIESFVTDEEGRYPDINNHLIDCAKYLMQISHWKLVDNPDPTLNEGLPNYSKTIEIAPEEWANNVVENSLWINSNDIYAEYYN